MRRRERTGGGDEAPKESSASESGAAAGEPTDAIAWSSDRISSWRPRRALSSPMTSSREDGEGGESGSASDAGYAAAEVGAAAVREPRSSPWWSPRASWRDGGTTGRTPAGQRDVARRRGRHRSRVLDLELRLARRAHDDAGGVRARVDVGAAARTHHRRRKVYRLGWGPPLPYSRAMALRRIADASLARRLFGAVPARTLALVRAAWPRAVGPDLARRTEVVGARGRDAARPRARRALAQGAAPHAAGDPRPPARDRRGPGPPAAGLRGGTHRAAAVPRGGTDRVSAPRPRRRPASWPARRSWPTPSCARVSWRWPRATSIDRRVGTHA